VGYGLKQRDNDQVRAAFVAEVQANCDAWGLTLPPWTPDWEQADSQERFGA
jgi:1,2-phenylacetyl-CoA epoxidase catalytic subunit